jgi:hypothetical protein
MSGYNPKFDIPSNNFNFDDDLSFGHLGEEMVKQFYEQVIQGNAEIKTDRYRNGRMVVETQQNPRRACDATGAAIWVNSGINVTDARWWIYVFALEQAMVIVNTQRLRNYLRAKPDRFNESTKRIFAKSSDNPAKGFLLEPEDVSDLLINPSFDG